MPRFSAIVAMDEARVIGAKGGIPWHLPEDLKHFSRLTRGHAVLMGRKTYESLPPKYRPLPDRLNIVISRTVPAWPGVEVFDSLESCLEAIEAGKLKLPSDQVWIVGGSQIYAATKSLWSEVRLTRVSGTHEADTFFPEFEADFELVEREAHDGYAFERYVRRGR